MLLTLSLLSPLCQPTLVYKPVAFCTACDSVLSSQTETCSFTKSAILIVMIRIRVPLLSVGTFERTNVYHNVVMHIFFLNPFAIFTLCKPIIVGSKPISVAQKLYSPLLRSNEEVDSALRRSAFRESKHHLFRTDAACTINSCWNCASGMD